MVFTTYLEEQKQILKDFELKAEEEKGKMATPFFVEDLLKKYELPVVVKIVPSKRNKYFGFDTRPHKLNKVILIKTYQHTNLKCDSNDGVVQIPGHDSMLMNFTSIKANQMFPTIRCLCKSKLKYSWFVNTRRFVYSNYVYLAGQIFRVHKCPSLKKCFKSRDKTLHVCTYPQGKYLKLHQHVIGNFQICDSPLVKNERYLSDILQSEKAPYIISVPSATKEKHNLCVKSEQSLFVSEITTTEIIIAIRISRNYKTIHTFPKSLPVEVDIDENDVTPFDVPDSADIKLIEEKLIKSDLEYSLTHHQSCLYEDLGIQRRKRIISVSLEDFTCPIIIEDDFVEDMVTQFWNSHDNVSILPSEEFFNNTGTLERVGSFWSITGPRKMNNGSINCEPIYEKLPCDKEEKPNIQISFHDDNSIKKNEHAMQDPKFLTVFERFTLNNKRRCSKILNLITGRQSYKEMKSCADGFQHSDREHLPRNSCPYLDFHLVNVDQECSNILSELRTYSKSSDNLDVKSSRRSTFDLAAEKI